MVKIKKQLISDTRNKLGRSNKRTYITIHETANTSKGANAQAHANLQSNGNSRAANWHWQVDDKQAIQSFTHDFSLYHCGDGGGSGNRNSIGIEICVNSDGDYVQAVKNAAALTRKIMAEENIPLSRVVQHNHWSGKNCPTGLRQGREGLNWHKFISLVKGVDVEQASKPQVKPQSKPSKVKPQTTKLAVDGYWGHATTRALQRYFGTTVDGVISGQPNNASVRNIPSARVGTSGSILIRTMQRYFKSGTIDGKISNPSQLISAMQRRYGTTVDGHISKPSLLVKELQRRLNEGKKL